MEKSILPFSLEEIKTILSKYHERYTGKEIDEMSGQSLLNLFDAARSKDLLQYLYCHMN